MSDTDITDAGSVSGTDEEKDIACCNHCQSNSECVYWVRSPDGSNCWLKKTFTGFTDYSGGRSSFRNMAPAMHKACCNACEADSQCQFWTMNIYDTQNRCWLKKDFTGYSVASNVVSDNTTDCYAWHPTPAPTGAPTAAPTIAPTPAPTTTRRRRANNGEEGTVNGVPVVYITNGSICTDFSGYRLLTETECDGTASTSIVNVPFGCYGALSFPLLLRL